MNRIQVVGNTIMIIGLFEHYHKTNGIFAFLVFMTGLILTLIVSPTVWVKGVHQ